MFTTMSSFPNMSDNINTELTAMPLTAKIHCQGTIKQTHSFSKIVALPMKMFFQNSTSAEYNLKFGPKTTSLKSDFSGI